MARQLISFHARALRGRRAGFILSEFLVSVAVLMAATLSLLMEGTAHLTLAEHARNVGVATNDAVRTLEQLRQQNIGTGCITPSAAPPVGFASWDAWLGDPAGGGGKSIQPSPLTNEMVLVRTAGASPLQVTVSVCWRHRNRTLGGCGWDGAQLTDPGGVAPVPSPVQLFTRVTCQP
ncbi:MAG: hypothetical protein HYW10_04590 [Candidatus Omnitrophica bacterium]|nr:hypothetical protein [Candidatus Omnitrophota bacterium]